MEVASVEAEDKRRLTLLRFEAAVKVIKSLAPDGPFQPSNDMMLKFYSYYKQATVGECNIPRPGFWDAVGKAKWDAWSSLGDMPKEDAMAAYVDEMKLILEGMPMTDEVEELLRVLGPFYELIDEKKKITQISDLSTGLNTMLNSGPSKSVAKSIVRTMKMNGTLETHPARLQSKEVKEKSEEEEEDEDDEEEEEEEEVLIREVRKDKKSAASPPKKKSVARSPKAPSNGKLLNGVAHLANGNHPRAALNNGSPRGGSPGETLLNGHHSGDPGVEVSGPSQMASDSDSEVYCDSVDQFGQEESSEHNRSFDDLDEEENHVPPGLEDPRIDVHGAPRGIRCGGEDGENGEATSQRPSEDRPDSSLVRSGRGPRGGGGHESPMPSYGGGDGDGERWGGGEAPAGSLNELIVVALARLQEDMQSVLQRLQTLEALTTSQTRSMPLPAAYASTVNRRSPKPSWWPFDISPTSLAFAVIWPFVAQWLIRLYLQRRRRRIN
ncbi:acbd5 [Pungitius sinensis]